MRSAKEGVTQTGSLIDTINHAQPSPQRARRRARRDLRPIEAALMARYRVELSGNVLELRSRGDALTDVLQYHARSLTGIALSASEVKLCRKRYPGAGFLQQELIDLEEFEDGQFDAVVAGRYALDALADNQRSRLLGGLSRVVADTGVVIFSSHNLACESLVRAPLHHAIVRPWKLPRLGRGIRNRALLGPLQQRSYGFALLNDGTDAYGRLSYYVSRGTQERQLHDHDFRLVECVDRNDVPVGAGNDGYREPELHFVARPGAELWSNPLLGGDLI